MGKKKTQVVDAHCHLADPRIEEDLPRILEEAQAAGIGCFVQGGVDPGDWRRQADLKAKFPGRIVTSYGLHPWWVAAHAKSEVEKGFKELERKLSEADALGETGLDFSAWFDQSTHALQSWAFEKQLELQRRFPTKPLVLHIVRAHDSALAILKAEEEAGSRRLSGLVHSFSGSQEIARKYLDLGLNLSISGVVTRKGFETLRKAMRYIPGDRLLLETDSPDQPPAGWGKRLNEPSALLGTAELVANLRGESVDALLERCTNNLKRLFGPKVIQ